MLGGGARSLSSHTDCLLHLAEARLTVPNQHGRSSPREVRARVERLLAHWRKKDRAAISRRNREAIIHSAIKPVIETPEPVERDEYHRLAEELPDETVWDRDSVEQRKARRSWQRGRRRRIAEGVTVGVAE